MKVLIVVCAVIALASSAALPRDVFGDWEGRIVGGSNAVLGQFPYQVSLRNSNNGHFCGGFIRNARWTVSAAHCTVGRTLANNVAVIGSINRVTGGFAHASAQVINHPNYNANNLANDISLLQNTIAFTFNANVASIALGTAHVGVANAVVSGWGQTSNPGSAATTLQFLNTQTLTNDDCRSRHTSNNHHMLFDNSICAFIGAGTGTCFGDSGGPLVVGSTVVGVVNWGVGCAQGFPDVYARISSHNSWINSHN